MAPLETRVDQHFSALLLREGYPTPIHTVAIVTASKMLVALVISDLCDAGNDQSGPPAT